MDFAHDLDPISDDEDDDLGYYVLVAYLLRLVGSAMESSMLVEDIESWQRTSITGQFVSHTHKLRLSVCRLPEPGRSPAWYLSGADHVWEVSWID